MLPELSFARFSLTWFLEEVLDVFFLLDEIAVAVEKQTSLQNKRLVIYNVDFRTFDQKSGT